MAVYALRVMHFSAFIYTTLFILNPACLLCNTPPLSEHCTFVLLLSYSTAQMQGITNARLRSRATAFVSACERVPFSSRTRSPPRSNAFASACERVPLSSRTHSPPLTNAFLQTQTLRMALTVASARLQPPLN